MAIIVVTLAVASAASAAGTSSRDGRLLAQDDGRSWNAAVYDRALNRVRLKCRESRHRVAEMTYNAKHVLINDGYYSTNLALLRALNLAIPWAIAPTRCSDMLAAIVVLMEKG